MGNYSVLALQVGERRLRGAEGLVGNKRFFFFARLGLSWLSLGNAIKCSFLQSEHIVYIWPKHGTEKRKNCLEQKTADGGEMSLKLNFQGFFLAFKNPKLENMLFVCGHTGNIHCLFPVDKTKMLLSIDQSRKPFLFSLSHSSVLNFTPG